MSLPLPASRRALLSAGRTRHSIDGALRNGSVVAPFRGIHVDPCLTADLAVRARAALLTQGPRAVVAGPTAAALLGLRWLPTGWTDPGAAVHVAVPPADAHRHRPGLRLRRRTLHTDEIVAVADMPCTGPARTIVELARDSSIAPTLVVQIIDGALRDGRVRLGELLACLDRMPGQRGVARARELVGLAREGVDSPPETSMRLALWFDGIREMDIGIEIRDDVGVVLARGDLGVRRLLIWAEYDGYDVHTRRPTFRGDRVGDRWLQRRGWHVMRFVDDDLRRPAQLCAEWRRAVADAPRRVGALPPGLSPEADDALRLLDRRVGDHGVCPRRTP